MKGLKCRFPWLESLVSAYPSVDGLSSFRLLGNVESQSLGMIGEFTILSDHQPAGLRYYMICPSTLLLGEKMVAGSAKKMNPH